MATLEPLAPGLHLMDCMEGMRRFPDGYFDLAIVDPPYGDGNANIGGGVRFGGWFDRYKAVEPVRPALRPVQDGTDLPGGQPSPDTCRGGYCRPNRGNLGR